MKISIVTISYNQGRFLEETICSIIEQNYKNIEYIVVDAGSTDESLDIIERYRKYISHVILEPDEGPADGLNKGFSIANGEIFGFLNADDLILPGSLQAVSDYFVKHPDIDIVMGNGFKINEQGYVIYPIITTNFTIKGYFSGRTAFLQQAMFFRKQAFLRIGGFNKANKTCWDGELFLRMAQAGCRFGLMDNYLASFRWYKDSISGSGRLYGKILTEHRRLFLEFLGREENHMDKLCRSFFRILKWVISPRITILKVKNFFLE
ncbi:MAG: hypothetical protein BWK78_08310 [Thiotrichaceae bacterium IS1]|nr:MAG: hypothetical protein BWK78_08310 [Thiotrichaceae bacterium IS1]